MGRWDGVDDDGDDSNNNNDKFDQKDNHRDDQKTDKGHGKESWGTLILKLGRLVVILNLSVF